MASDDEDLDALRLAALATLKPKAEPEPQGIQVLSNVYKGPPTGHFSQDNYQSYDQPSFGLQPVFMQQQQLQQQQHHHQQHQQHQPFQHQQQQHYQQQPYQQQQQNQTHHPQQQQSLPFRGGRGFQRGYQRGRGLDIRGRGHDLRGRGLDLRGRGMRGRGGRGRGGFQFSPMQPQPSSSALIVIQVAGGEEEKPVAMRTRPPKTEARSFFLRPQDKWNSPGGAPTSPQKPKDTSKFSRYHDDTDSDDDDDDDFNYTADDGDEENDDGGVMDNENDEEAVLDNVSYENEVEVHRKESDDSVEDHRTVVEVHNSENEKSEDMDVNISNTTADWTLDSLSDMSKTIPTVDTSVNITNDGDINKPETCAPDSLKHKGSVFSRLSAPVQQSADSTMTNDSEEVNTSQETMGVEGETDENLDTSGGLIREEVRPEDSTSNSYSTFSRFNRRNRRRSDSGDESDDVASLPSSKASSVSRASSPDQASKKSDIDIESDVDLEVGIEGEGKDAEQNCGLETDQLDKQSSQLKHSHSSGSHQSGNRYSHTQDCSSPKAAAVSKVSGKSSSSESSSESSSASDSEPSSSSRQPSPKAAPKFSQIRRQSQSKQTTSEPKKADSSHNAKHSKGASDSEQEHRSIKVTNRKESVEQYKVKRKEDERPRHNHEDNERNQSDNGKVRSRYENRKSEEQVVRSRHLRSPVPMLRKANSPSRRNPGRPRSNEVVADPEFDAANYRDESMYQKSNKGESTKLIKHRDGNDKARIDNRSRDKQSDSGKEVRHFKDIGRMKDRKMKDVSPRDRSSSSDRKGAEDKYERRRESDLKSSGKSDRDRGQMGRKQSPSQDKWSKVDVRHKLDRKTSDTKNVEKDFGDRRKEKNVTKGDRHASGDRRSDQSKGSRKHIDSTDMSGSKRISSDKTRRKSAGHSEKEAKRKSIEEKLKKIANLSESSDSSSSDSESDKRSVSSLEDSSSESESETWRNKKQGGSRKMTDIELEIRKRKLKERGERRASDNVRTRGKDNELSQRDFKGDKGWSRRGRAEYEKGEYQRERSYHGHQRGMGSYGEERRNTRDESGGNQTVYRKKNMVFYEEEPVYKKKFEEIDSGSDSDTKPRGGVVKVVKADNKSRKAEILNLLDIKVTKPVSKEKGDRLKKKERLVIQVGKSSGDESERTDKHKNTVKKHKTKKKKQKYSLDRSDEEGETRREQVVNVTFDGKDESQNKKVSIRERLGLPVNSGSESRSSGVKRAKASEQVPAEKRIRLLDRDKHRDTGKQRHRDNMDETGDNPDALEKRIKKIKEKNVQILRRQREVDQDKQKYG